MMNNIFVLYLCILIILNCYQFTSIFAQTTTSVDTTEIMIVDSIIIKGNKKTKNFVILRELDFAIGDTIVKKQLVQMLAEGRNQIFNLELFNEVIVEYTELKKGHIQVTIAVEERWYILPIPIFELADRNFNVWWQTQNQDWRRLLYGIRFYHDNFRGRKEQVKLALQLGYTKKLELSYRAFIDRKRQTALRPFISYITNKEVNYTTQGNQYLFYEHSERLRTRFRTGIALTRRPNIHISHHTRLAFFQNSVADTLALLNPDYFLEGRNQQKYVHLEYHFIRDFRDIAAYPRKGSFFHVSVAQSGFQIFKDLTYFEARLNYSYYFSWRKRWFGALNTRNKWSYPQQQPYFNQQGLSGEREYLRGYELYIIDGQAFTTVRTAIRYELLSIKFKNPIIKAHQFRTIPLSIYLKTYAETAYVQDKYYAKQNPLSNTWLASFGLGIDIFTFYDNVLSFEYTRNHLNTWGFYIAFSINYD